MFAFSGLGLDHDVADKQLVLIVPHLPARVAVDTSNFQIYHPPSLFRLRGANRVGAIHVPARIGEHDLSLAQTPDTNVEHRVVNISRNVTEYILTIYAN